MALPSGSAAVTLTVRRPLSATVAVAGAVTTGVWSVTNSIAPRSEYFTGPAPVLETAGASTRACPVASVEGQFGAPESAASMAGEPASREKSPPAAFTKFGLACRECASCRLAPWYVASVVWFVAMYRKGAAAVEFQKML